MHSAAWDGRLAELKLVVEFAPERINEINSYYNTPLHLVASWDKEAVVSLLLSAKADVNKTDTIGRTPLHLAAQCSREAAVSLLLSAKADVNKTDNYGSTPLGYANSDRVKQLLIDAGAH